MLVKLKELLRKHLSEEELRYAPPTFDVVGSREKAVAIVEIHPALEDEKYLVAEAIMKIHKNVRTVLRKLSERCTE